jgi:hypothetical protein
VAGADLPARLARTLLARADTEPATRLTQVPKDRRRRLLELVAAFPIDVVDTRGYAKAEVTAGGVPLEEIDVRRMMSRRAPGLFLAGEIVDVDGRLGGYNFQWAWSSGGWPAFRRRPGSGTDHEAQREVELAGERVARLGVAVSSSVQRMTEPSSGGVEKIPRTPHLRPTACEKSVRRPPMK